MNWNRALVAVLAGVPVVALLGFGLTRDPKAIPSTMPGREAPEFILPVFAAGDGATSRPVGDTVRLADLRGDIVVVNFWASWCLACRDEHSVLSQAAEHYAGRGVRFFGVLYNDRPGSGTRWIAEMGGQSYPSLQDRGSRTAIDYGLYGVPETFFIGRDGRVAYKHIGPVTGELLVAKLDSMLAAAAPLP